MNGAKPDPRELTDIYSNRFDARTDYRNAVWRVLTSRFFHQWIHPNDAVLDLGSGYGEFINQIQCKTKFAMDLNSASRGRLSPNVQFLEQDCSAPWPIPADSLDVIFTSNFFEHLPNKKHLGSTLDNILKALRPGGSVIAMGPNIRIVRGAYWDFWDHYLPLTEKSLSEGLQTRGFEIVFCRAAFLPYTMSSGPQFPLWLLKVYLAIPVLWPFFGEQFLVIGRKPNINTSL